MTKVKKPVRRETRGTVFSQGKDRLVVVSIEPPNIVGFRLKGTHRTYRLTAEGCYMQAVKAYLAAAKREKKKAKKEKRK